MKKLFLSLLLVPMMAMAGNVKSPNGQIEVKFSVDNTGRPVYEMTYKGRAVVKLSRSPRRRRPLLTRPGSPYGVRPRTSVTTTTNWQQPWSSQPRSGRSSSASGCMTTVSVSVTSSPSSRN